MTATALHRLPDARVTARTHGFQELQPDVERARARTEGRCRECGLTCGKAELAVYGLCYDCREWVGLDTPTTEGFRPLGPPTNG